MRQLLQRSRHRLVLLAPRGSQADFGHVNVDADSHRGWLNELQRFRGQVYLRGSFLTANELHQGRHCAAEDHHSWHLLSVHPRGHISGCVRFRQHPHNVSFGRLTLAHSAMARCPEWSKVLRARVQDQLAVARQRRVAFVEVGGWALDESARGSSEAVRIALATFALSQLIGGAVGITTAREHGASPLLKKIGGHGLSLPPYYEPLYRCSIEVLRFHSWDPTPRFSAAIDEMRDELQSVQILRATREPRSHRLFTSALFAHDSVSPGAGPLTATEAAC